VTIDQAFIDTRNDALGNWPHCLWALRQYWSYRYSVTSIPVLIPLRFVAVSRYSVYRDTGIGGPTCSTFQTCILNSY